MSAANPRIRPLEPIPVEAEGQTLVVLRDPFRFVEEALTVSVPVYLLLTLMDGTRTVFDIQQAFRDQFGGQISAADVEQLVAELDEHCLMESERFESLRAKVLEEFQKSPVRLAAHAGGAYEGTPQELQAQLDKFYESVEKKPAAAKRPSALLGPDGLPIGGGEDESPETDAPGPWLLSVEVPGSIMANTGGLNGTPQAIIAPHIDPRVGGRCAAKAFAAVRSADPAPDLFVIFGTAHQPSDSLFILTEKSFETPLGTVDVDRETAAALKSQYSGDLLGDEFLHKHEHSIEFQVIFLQHLYGSRHKFQILPILVGSFHEFIQQNASPASQPIFADFMRALRQALKQSGKRVCLIAGADLSHIGHKFGDEEELSDALVDRGREKDRAMLRHLEAGSHEEFFQYLQRDGDRQKICGLPPIYTMLSALESPYSGQLLEYGLNVEEQTQSFVSFTSMAFYQKA